MYKRLAGAGLGILLIAACGENAFGPTVEPEAERIAPPTSGSHLTQQFLITPVALDFGQVTVGETSPEQFVVVTNVGHGGVAMSGSGGGAGVFGGVQNCQGTTLQEGASCVMAYSFTPTAPGVAEVTATGEWNGQQYSVALRGEGVARDRFAISATALDFGQVDVGGTSSEQTVRLTNQGPGPVVVSGTASVTGDFTVSESCAGATLAEGASCDMLLRFAPTTAGARDGTASVAWSGQSWSIALRGEGMQQPRLAIAKTSIDFGEVKVGGFSSLEIVDVTNLGPGAVALNGTGGSTTGFQTMQTCQGQTLAAGASCQMYYYFMPSAVGLVTETVTGSWNGQSYSISLRGEGIAADAQPTRRFLIGTRGIDFGHLAVGGSSAPHTVTVTNLGPGPVAMNGSGGVTGAFVGSQSCQGMTLVEGQSCEMSFRFTPASPGETTGTASGAWNGEPYSLALRGVGVQRQRFLITPTAHDFGNIDVGASSPEHVVRVTNLGPGAIVMAGTGGAAAEFGGLQNCEGISLAEGASCEMRYSFAPTVAGEVVRTTSGSWNGQPFSFTFRGFGVQSKRFLISPVGLDFGEVELGATAPAQSVTITNLGPGSVTMAGVGGAATLFGGSQGCEGVTLAQGGTCAMTYTFAPTAAGSLSQTVTGSWNGQPYAIALRATGVAPVNPSVQFGEFLPPMNRRLRVQHGATLPVRVRLLDADGGALSDAESAALVHACSVVITFSETPDRPLCGRHNPGDRHFQVNLQIPRLVRAGVHHITVDVRVGDAVVSSGRAEIEVRGR